MHTRGLRLLLVAVAALVTLAVAFRWLNGTALVAGIEAAAPAARADETPGSGSSEARVDLDARPAALPLKASTDAELRAVTRFCRAAGPKDVPELRIAALHSRDALVAGNAVRALGRLGRVVDDVRLLALLEDERLRVRQEVVLALGLSGDTRAVGPLEHFLEQADAEIKPLIEQALRRLASR